MEDLRQKCVYQNAYDNDKRTQYWDYMKQVHSSCYDFINEACSEQAHKKLNIEWDATQNCVKDSFTSDDWHSADTNNTILDNEMYYYKKYGAHYYPSIVINNLTYRGQMEPTMVMMALCSGFSSTPGLCAEYFDND